MGRHDSRLGKMPDSRTSTIEATTTYNLHAYPPDEFRGGQITCARAFWHDTLLPACGLPSGLKRRIAGWVSEGVDINDFIKPFSGEFMGKIYDSPSPPPFMAPNHVIPDRRLTQFVTDELERLLLVGAIARESTAPRIVLPLGVEPDKPRLILDARYLNLWCPSEEMQYETLRHFQQGIDVDDWLFSLDHKSGYHHVPLTESCWQLVGFQWEGAYYTFRVLPFGWAPACFVYNSLSAVLASFIRIHGLHCIFYLDDFGFFDSKVIAPTTSICLCGGRARCHVSSRIYSGGAQINAPPKPPLVAPRFRYRLT